MPLEDSGSSPTRTAPTPTLSQPKPKPKIIRVLTVMAYMLSVSMAAILLSIYYIFVWNGGGNGATETKPSAAPLIAFKDIKGGASLVGGGYTESDEAVGVVNASYLEYEMMTEKGLIVGVVAQKNRFDVVLAY